MTRKKSPFIRWTLIRQVLGSFSIAMKERCGRITKEMSAHEETIPAAMKREEAHVDKLFEQITEK